MSFVKDDHAYTRGAGAIASMDAVSPARRRAMARAERALAVRDALMASSTLGATRQMAARESTIVKAGWPSRAIEGATKGARPGSSSTGKPPTGGAAGCAPGDQKSEFGCLVKKVLGPGASAVNQYYVCPPNSTPHSDMWCLRSAPPGRHAKPGRGQPGRGRAWSDQGARLVKSPGSVIGEPKEAEPKATIEPKAVSTALPTKGSTTIVGGGGTSWTSGGKAQPAAQLDMPPPEQLPEMPEEAPATPTTAPTTKPKTSSNLLVYAAIGAAALWFLTRK